MEKICRKGLRAPSLLLIIENGRRLEGLALPSPKVGLTLPTGAQKDYSF